MKMTATVSIDEKRDHFWLKFNKMDADNQRLIYGRGPEVVHHELVRVKDTAVDFRFWWKSYRSVPYLQAEGIKQWSFDAAYWEIKKLTGLPMGNSPGKPDKVTFNVTGSSGNYTLSV